MEASEEGLNANIFVRTLKRKYASVWQLTESEADLFICVPQSGVFKSVAQITQQVINSHVMKQSKASEGSILMSTLDGKSARYVKKDESDPDNVKSAYIETLDGWGAHPKDPAKRCEILYEELFYNSQWKKFRVVCIGASLLPGQSTGSRRGPKKKQSFVISQLPALLERTLKNSRHYLTSFPENEFVLKKIELYAHQFVEEYFVVRGYEKHARSNVLELAKKSTDDLLCTNKHFRFEFHYQDHQMDALSQLIENFLFGILHGPILASFREIYCREDDYFDRCVLSAKPRDGDFQLKSTAEIFRGLASFATPLEGLICLQKTVSSIYNETSSVVSADDLLPIIIDLVARFHVPKFYSLLCYVEFFTFHDLHRFEMGYCLSTFKAALEQIQSNHEVTEKKKKEDEEKKAEQEQ